MSIIHDALKKLEKEKAKATSPGPPPHNAPSDPAPAPSLRQPISGNLRPRTWHLPDLSFRKNLLGVDIGSSSIKVVRLKRMGDDCRLTGAGYLKLPFGVSESGIAAALKTLMKDQGIGKCGVASAIATKSLTFQHIHLPKMPKADLKEAVMWEVKKGIDFPDDAVIDYVVNDEIQEEGKTKLSILAFAVKKKEVLGHLEMLKEASLAPEAIDVGPMALLSAFDYNYGWDKVKRCAILDIGASKTILSIVSNGSLRFTRIIPLAGNAVTKEIQDAEYTDFQTAEEKKIRYASALNNAPEAVRAAVESFMEGISLEVLRSFNYYEAHYREGSVQNILVSGGCARISGLADYIKNNLGVPTAVYDSMRRLAVKGGLYGTADAAALSPVLAEAVGLALRREGE